MRVANLTKIAPHNRDIAWSNANIQTYQTI